MLTQEMVVTIHVLHKQGKSIRAISDELGISRNTVRKYLRNGGAMPTYQRSPRPSKLDPYKAYLHKRIQAAGVCQASCPISYAANTTFLSKSLLSFDGFSQTSLTGFQLRTERFFQRSGLASLAVS